MSDFVASAIIMKKGLDPDWYPSVGTVHPEISGHLTGTVLKLNDTI